MVHIKFFFNFHDAVQRCPNTIIFDLLMYQFTNLHKCFNTEYYKSYYLKIVQKRKGKYLKVVEYLSNNHSKCIGCFIHIITCFFFFLNIFIHDVVHRCPYFYVSFIFDLLGPYTLVHVNAAKLIIMNYIAEWTEKGDSHGCRNCISVCCLLASHSGKYLEFNN